MGSVVSTVADRTGSALGTLISSPIKTIFGGSCENICVGTWDIFCFIEHFCISSLAKVAMVSLLIYILMLFFYLLYQIGIVQCIGRSICKMTWASCEAYWSAVEDISCFLWHKLRNVKRVHRRRRDLEAAYSSSDKEEEDDDDSVNNYESLRVAISKKRPLKDRRKNRIRSSLRPRKHRSGVGANIHVSMPTGRLEFLGVMEHPIVTELLGTGGSSSYIWSAVLCEADLMYTLF